ncbi:MAG: hypothetical protein JW850_12835 [Thermoflexales bacterium]|nr:hypothetical protein [Thermoflexales bacterium]
MRKLALRDDHLWLLICLAWIAFFVSLLPLDPNDFWWHLKAGELIAVTGKIPATNLFAWSLPPDQPYVYGAWLAEWLFYQIFRLGGVPLLLFARTLVVVGAFALAWRTARQKGGAWPNVMVLWSFMMASNNLVMRPQIFALLPFVAFVALLDAYATGRLNARWLLALPALMAFWVNVHGSFVLGLVLVGITIAGEAISDRACRKFKCLCVVGILVGLAVLVNPRGPHIVGYVTNLMTDSPSQMLVEEWQSPAADLNAFNVLFFASLVALLAVLTYSRKRPTPTEALLLVAFSGLAMSGQRYIVWYALAAMPVLSRLFGGLVAPSASVSKSAWRFAAGLLVFAPAVLVQPWWVERVPLPGEYWQMVQRNVAEGPILSISTPVRAADYLRQHPGGRLFAEMGYASYLIWAVPGQGVFVDPRVELYPFEQWVDYLRISNGTCSGELLDKYGVDRVLLDVELQDGLARAMEAEPGWVRVYEDEQSQLWERAGWQQ